MSQVAMPAWIFGDCRGAFGFIKSITHHPEIVIESKIQWHIIWKAFIAAAMRGFCGAPNALIGIGGFLRSTKIKSDAWIWG